MGKNRNGSFIDDMVDMFGYDYVMGYCLCQEYDLLNKAKREYDKEKREKLQGIASKYRVKINQLEREMMSDGL